jgi:hypothetical protein
MDTFLYNKFSTNLNKLKKKLEKIKQKGGLIPYPPPIFGEPVDKSSDTEQPYYNIINFGREFDNDEIRNFRTKHLDGSLKIFAERIKEVEKLVSLMDQSKLSGMAATLTPAQFTQVKNEYLDYISAYKNKIIRDSYFELDPDLHPAVFYETKTNAAEFNEKIKNLFNLFVEKSKITDINSFKQNLEQNITELKFIIDKCNEFDIEIDKYINQINIFLECDNKDAYNNSEVFLTEEIIREKNISEYDYTSLINYTGDIDDIFINGSRFNNFVSIISSVIQQNKFGELEIPKGIESKIIESVYIKLMQKKSQFSPLNILDILSKKFSKTEEIKKNISSFITKDELAPVETTPTVPEKIKPGSESNVSTESITGITPLLPSTIPNLLPTEENTELIPEINLTKLSAEELGTEGALGSTKGAEGLLPAEVALGATEGAEGLLSAEGALGSTKGAEGLLPAEVALGATEGALGATEGALGATEGVLGATEGLGALGTEPLGTEGALPTTEETQLTGGNIYNNLYINEGTSNILSQIITKVDEVNKKVNDFKEKYNKLILTLKRMDLYKFYLKLIVYNLWEKQNYVVFKYINKGLCQYYYGILEDIIEKFKSIGAIQREIDDVTGKKINPTYYGISYLNRYHYITITKLYNFFKSLLELDFFDNSMIIDIDALNNVSDNSFFRKMKDNFMLFNNFKDILDSFKETFQNKVTIFGRINDRKEKDKIISEKDKMFTKDKDNGRYLNVNTARCKADTVMIPKQIKFNEVFDTTLDTQTISKYMTMASQITKGKGVVIMTYGYSGTGKTFTLFGKYDKDPALRKQGILQSTLSNIIGVKKIYLRVYELYGKGTIFNQYWDNPDNLDQMIFNYQFNVKEEDIGENIEKTDNKKITKNKILELNNETPVLIKDNKNINSFFNNNFENTQNKRDGYTLISSNDDDTKSIFQAFSEFIQQVEDKRENGIYFVEKNKKSDIKRVTSTPNNPQSSRSILVYEFYIQVEDKIIPFIVIDLPGREEIIPSYCDAHIKQVESALKANPAVNTKLLSELKANKELYKTILSSYVLNPLALNLFYNKNKSGTKTTSRESGYKLIMNNIINNQPIDLSPTSLDKFLNDNFEYDENLTELIDINITDNSISPPKQVKFSYKQNMFEGIYINENIMGLTQILTNIIKQTKKDLSDDNIYLQDVIKEKINSFLIERVDKLYNPITPNTIQIVKPLMQINSKDTKYTINNFELENIYKYNKEIYNTKKIYIKDKSKIIIGTILNKYNQDNIFDSINDDEPTKLKPVQIKKVDSYKLFYLVTNNDSDKKCFHQYELLENTMSLINAIRN